MRQVLSWRFVAALAALAGLALLISALLVGRDTVARIAEHQGPTSRRADLIAIVLDTDADDFALREDGTTRGRLTLKLHSDRSVTIFPGTSGTSSCDDLDKAGACAVLAETLGDTIVSFAFVPMSFGLQIELPAIRELSGGFAQLANGWQVPYAPVIDRSRCDSPAESFSEFLRLVGRHHRSVYRFGPGEITAVTC
jgi:hypothetical protein